MTESQAPQRTLGPGDVLDGRYRLEELLGSGGFGQVFRAIQLNIGRPVALKLLHREVLAHAEGIGRFRREASVAQQLSHPHTVHLLDVGQTEDGQPFIVLELLKGRSLNSLLYDEGTLDPERVRNISSKILMSLMEAHALGIVHRDIKPENIFLVDAAGMPDYVKVLDFGLAKAIEGSAATSEQVTAYGETVGTPNYMSPEQVRGRELTPLTDIYSLGLVMGEMLSGTMIYEGNDGLKVARRQISSEPVPLPPIVTDSPLARVIAIAVEKDPTRRFQSAEEMLSELEMLKEACSGSQQSSRKNAEFADTIPMVSPFAEGARDAPETERSPALIVIDDPPRATVGDTLPTSVSVEVDEALLDEAEQAGADDDPQETPPEVARPADSSTTKSPRTSLLLIIGLIILGSVGLGLGWWLAFWGMG